MNNNFILFVLSFLCSSFTKEHFTAFPTVTFKCHLKTETPTKLNSLVALISVASPPFLGCGWLCIWSALAAAKPKAPITREAWSAGVGEASWETRMLERGLGSRWKSWALWGWSWRQAGPEHLEEQLCPSLRSGLRGIE